MVFLWSEIGPLAHAREVHRNGDVVQRYLARQTVVRVLVVGAPGYGHQMTAVAWIRRLRELGYNGPIEIVTERNTLAKLQVLLPELSWPAPTMSELSESNVPLEFKAQNIRIVGANELRTELAAGRAQEVSLAIVPAEDLYDKTSVVRAYRANRPTPRSFLGATAVLRMQPSDWRDGYRSMEHARSGDTVTLEDLASLPLALPAFPRPENMSSAAIRDWLARTVPRWTSREIQLVGEMLAEDGSGGVKRAESLAFYCAHEEQVMYLTRLALGAHANISASAEAGPYSKPIRIWVMSPMTDFQWNLAKRIIGDGTAEGATAVEFVDLTSSSASGMISVVNFPRLQIVRLNQPAPALVRLLAEISSLPPAVAGSYSRNIMYQLGKPFIELKFFHDAESALSLTGEIRDAAMAVYGALNQEPGQSVDLAGPLARFWRVARTPESKRMFSSRRLVEPDQDLVYRSLARLANFAECEETLVSN